MPRVSWRPASDSRWARRPCPPCSSAAPTSAISSSPPPRPRRGPSPRPRWTACAPSGPAWPPELSHPGQLRLEAVKVLLVRLDGEPLDLGAFSGSVEEHLKGEPGLAGLFGEGGCYLEPRARHMPDDDPLRSHDLDKNALVLVVDAIRAVHDEAPGTARPHVELLERVRESFRPPPLREVLGIGPRLEHELTRRVDDARGDDLSVGERLRGTVFFHARLRGPLCLASARRMSSFDGRPGSMTFRAVSAPAIGNSAGLSSPSWTRTDAWSQ